MAMPRAVGFYRADDTGPSTSYLVIAWGLRHPDGWVATVSPEPPRVTALWPNVEAAELGLDAFMDDHRHGTPATETSAGG